MVDRLDNYRENLRHVVRPEERNERQASPSFTLADYEALYLRQCLREYAAYEAPSQRKASIAWAYAEYADMCVRDERRSEVAFYAHTTDAYEVLVESLLTTNGSCLRLQKQIRAAVDTLREDLEL